MSGMNGGWMTARRVSVSMGTRKYSSEVLPSVPSAVSKVRATQPYSQCVLSVILSVTAQSWKFWLEEVQMFIPLIIEEIYLSCLGFPKQEHQNSHTQQRLNNSGLLILT